MKKSARPAKEAAKALKQNRINNNPWSDEPTNKPIGFGMLNDILREGYGQAPTNNASNCAYEEELREIEDKLERMKNRYQIALNVEKELLYGQHQQLFKVQQKMAQLNRIIAFVDKADQNQQEKTPSIPLGSSWVKLPVEAQTTFVKLFYRIGRGQTIEQSPSTLEQHFQSLAEAKRLLIERLFI